MGAKVNYYQNDVIVDSRPRSQRAPTNQERLYSMTINFW